MHQRVGWPRLPSARWPTTCRPRLRGAVRPAAAPDPAGAGRPLRGVAWPPSSTPTWPSSSACERLDLEVATEFLLIAATLVELKARRLLPGRDDVDLDEELALWEERDLLLARLLECKTFKDVAAVLRRLRRRRRPLVPARGRPRRALRRPAARPAGRRHGRAAPRTPSRGPLAPKPVPTVDLSHVAPDPGQRGRGGGRAGRRAAPGRADHVPPPHQRPRRAARGDRALPRRARAVQAGPGRARPARPSATSRSSGSARTAGAPSSPWPASTATRDEDDDDGLDRPTDAEPEALPGRARAGDRGDRDGGQRPGAAAAARPAAGDPGRARSRRCARGWPSSYEEARPRLPARAGGRWLPLPELTPTSSPTSSGSCSTTRAPGCRRRRSRRWRSSPTSSRSPAARSPASAASTPTA